jgi:hypothetical protein
VQGSEGGWDAGSANEEAVISSLQQLQLQYVPAGGNKYLAQQSKQSNLVCTGLAQGQGLSLLHLPALQSLMQLLAGLALPLADLAVHLRSIVLPVLPWLGSTASSTGSTGSTSDGQPLPETCADLAHTAAAAAGEIVELCSMLPAVPGCLSAAAIAKEARAAAEHAAAVRHANEWGSSAAASPETFGSRVQQQQQQRQGLELDPADQQLLDDLAVLLLPAASRQQGSKSRDQHGISSRSSSSGGGAGCGASTAGGGISSPQGKAGSGGVQQQQQGALLLQKLTRRWRVLWFKRCVLEHQLSFVSRCSAEQTKLVSGLVQRVAAAAADAADAFEADAGLQELRDDAMQLCRQLLRALLLVEQQGSSGSAVRALVGVLQQHQETVEALPEVRWASAKDLSLCFRKVLLGDVDSSCMIRAVCLL